MRERRVEWWGEKDDGEGRESGERVSKEAGERGELRQEKELLLNAFFFFCMRRVCEPVHTNGAGERRNAGGDRDWCGSESRRFGGQCAQCAV